MNWETISSVLISAVVIAAIITSTINFVIAILNSKSLKRIEKERQDNSIIQYRYKELHSILKDWIDFSRTLDASLDTDTILPDKVIINYLNDALRVLKQKYDIALSLVDKEIWNDMEKYFSELYEAKERCYIWIIEDNNKISYRTTDYEGVSNQYIDCYKKTKQYFESVINLQLQKISSNKNK